MRKLKIHSSVTKRGVIGPPPTQEFCEHRHKNPNKPCRKVFSLFNSGTDGFPKNKKYRLLLNKIL
jgi:hypothetical protein